jgi:hypothetical protein
VPALHSGGARLASQIARTKSTETAQKAENLNISGENPENPNRLPLALEFVK